MTAHDAPARRTVPDRRQLRRDKSCLLRYRQSAWKNTENPGESKVKDNRYIPKSLQTLRDRLRVPFGVVDNDDNRNGVCLSDLLDLAEI